MSKKVEVGDMWIKPTKKEFIFHVYNGKKWIETGRIPSKEKFIVSKRNG